MTDLTGFSTLQLVHALRSHLACGEDPTITLDELERRVSEAGVDEDVTVLPIAVTDRIRELFGGGRRTFEAMAKRCRFALQVWQGKYGDFTPEQAEYAVSVLLWALDPKVIKGHPNARACAYERLDRVVHHERTHAGFKQREGQLVDVSRELGEL